MIGILGKIEHCALAARRVSFNHFGEKTNEARWLMIAPRQTRASYSLLQILLISVDV